MGYPKQRLTEEMNQLGADYEWPFLIPLDTKICESALCLNMEVRLNIERVIRRWNRSSSPPVHVSLLSLFLSFRSPTTVNTIVIMLQLIGLGLADETDITVKGLEMIKKAERVYLEAYTSILLVDTAKLVSARAQWPSALGHSHFM